MGLLNFLRDNWTYLGGFAAVAAAAMGWVLTYAGWRQVHKNNEALEWQKFQANLRLEKEKFITSLNLDKRRAELRFVSDQIQLLYGPLYALHSASENAFRSFVLLHANPDGNIDDVPLTVHNFHFWRLWMTEVMMPLNLRMEQAIVENAHLIDGAAIPNSFQAFLSHVASYKAAIKGWKDAEQAGSLEKLTARDHVGIIDFPGEFKQDVEVAYKKLRQRQLNLLRETKDTRTPPDLDNNGDVALAVLHAAGDGKTPPPAAVVSAEPPGNVAVTQPDQLRLFLERFRGG
jgi:hypothetical protein